MDAAESIKRSYIYGLSAGQTTFEAPDTTGATKTFEREQVELIQEARTDEICEAIQDAIKESGVKLSNWSTIYLTGGGLAINRGGRDYLSAKLERPVRELPRKAVKLSSPAYSSALGLLDLVIDTISSNRSAAGGLAGFFRNLFGG
jgi:cell division ATPase FtsA